MSNLAGWPCLKGGVTSHAGGTWSLGCPVPETAKVPMHVNALEFLGISRNLHRKHSIF